MIVVYVATWNSGEQELQTLSYFHTLKYVATSFNAAVYIKGIWAPPRIHKQNIARPRRFLAIARLES